jgi:hypothetical protein
LGNAQVGGRWAGSGAAGPARRVVATLVLAALVVVAAGACGGGGKKAVQVARVAVGVAGVDPFTPAVGTDQEGVVRPDTAGPIDGGTPGLYGGTRDSKSCDADKLIAFLEANTAKAAVWAGVRRIRPADIARYIKKLTAVFLRIETLVTNHGFEDGKATDVPSVLQPGTGVLIDESGVPVAKCNCGNPLTELEQETTELAFTGDSWPGFSEARTASVRPGRAASSRVLVDLTGRQAFERSPGKPDVPTSLPPPLPTPPPSKESTAAATEPQAGPPYTYDPETLQEARGACDEAGVPGGYCQCLLDKYQAQYSQEEFLEIDANPDTPRNREIIERITMECLPGS